MTPRAKVFGALMPVPTAVPPRGSSPSRGQARVRRRSMPCSIGGGVAAELLSQGDRRGVHEVGATGLHHRLELALLLAQSACASSSSAGTRSTTIALRRGQVDGRREHVVRRLRCVDVVVRVHRVAERLRRQVGQHLVHVHVRRRARARLVHVDREVVVPRPRTRPRRPPRRWRRAMSSIEDLQPGVHQRRRPLDRAPAPRSGRARCAGRRWGSSRRPAASGAATAASAGTLTSPIESCSIRYSVTRRDRSAGSPRAIWPALGCGSRSSSVGSGCPNRAALVVCRR